MTRLISLIDKNKLLVLILLVAAFMRLWQMGNIPQSLYIDELDLGYQAYSLLHTGRDYFGNLLPLHPHSFAEYRTPFNIYSAIPTIWLFGINAYGVRLPSAIFGVLVVLSFYLLIKEIISFKRLVIDKMANMKKFTLFGALILAFSPWHIQFSRVTLEVSALFFFLTLGLYLFFKSFKTPKILWLSAMSLGLTPWIYSTAKFFVAVLIAFLLLAWHKEILRFPKKDLIKSLIVLLVLGLPMIYITLGGKAGSRFSYISVFSDPTARTEVNFAREFDTVVRGENQIGAQPSFSDKFFHNKISYWADNIISNYLDAISFDFLFFKGDPNLRHSSKGTGEFYWLEIIPLIAGIVLFFSKYKDKKIKFFIAFWILIGIIPSAVTRDGGNHAPRLILILPPLIFLITYGLVYSMQLLKENLKKLVIFCYAILWTLSFSFYLHDYLIHYPWDSERWWNSGYRQMVEEIKKIENNYEKIVITTADEPPLIFFAAYYPYDPIKWQEAVKNGSLTGEDGGVKRIGKFYFDQYRVDTLSGNLDDSSVYIASAREVTDNLIIKPSTIPQNLNLIRSISLPSGEPVFYFFTKKGS